VYGKISQNALVGAGGAGEVDPYFGTFLDRADGQSFYLTPRRHEVLGWSIALTLFWDFLPILELGRENVQVFKAVHKKNLPLRRGQGYK
jgi:hypothetical protein